MEIDQSQFMEKIILININIIKMAVVPQFNYICMMIPVTISDRIFKYNHLIKDSFWNGMKSRIGLTKLFVSRDCGGLARQLYNSISGHLK